MTVLYFDCFSGASGDMILGALLDAGLPIDDLRRALGARGREIALAEFTVERFVAEALAVYGDLSPSAARSGRPTSLRA